MKEAIVKIDKTESWFREKIKLTSLQSDSSRKKVLKNTNTWKLKNIFLNNILLKKSKAKSKNFQKQMTMKIQQLEMYGMQQKQF